MVLIFDLKAMLSDSKFVITSVPKCVFFFFLISTNVWWHWLLPILTNKGLQVKNQLDLHVPVTLSVLPHFPFHYRVSFTLFIKKLWYAWTPKILKFSFKLFKKLTKLNYFRLPRSKNYELLRGKKKLMLILHHCYYATWYYFIKL